MFRKLRLREFAETDIEQVLATLTQEKLLSHERFTENYIRYRRGKGFGPVRIRAELIERGVEEELIEHHLNIADNAWFIEARQAWQKRFKNRWPEDYKARAQQMRFLQSRGFTIEQCQSIFANLSSLEQL